MFFVFHKFSVPIVVKVMEKSGPTAGKVAAGPLRDELATPRLPQSSPTKRTLGVRDPPDGRFSPLDSCRDREVATRILVSAHDGYAADASALVEFLDALAHTSSAFFTAIEYALNLFRRHVFRF